jgi:hypothetical protein
VGNIFTGDVTVFTPATNTVLETVALGTGTGVIDGVPIAIVFVNA